MLRIAALLLCLALHSAAASEQCAAGQQCEVRDEASLIQKETRLHRDEASEDPNHGKILSQEELDAISAESFKKEIEKNKKIDAEMQRLQNLHPDEVIDRNEVVESLMTDEERAEKRRQEEEAKSHVETEQERKQREDIEEFIKKHDREQKEQEARAKKEEERARYARKHPTTPPPPVTWEEDSITSLDKHMEGLNKDTSAEAAALKKKMQEMKAKLASLDSKEKKKWAEQAEEGVAEAKFQEEQREQDEKLRKEMLASPEGIFR
eukprot:gnl/TRDRNA2_/TRDRNA2_62222_c0_seq1.p1 gnl/TRDRNA2_/TRDRNA2_62222_c0~~gnl/TRDRNA2_/TRDRNA2_62222_c0_seq1.p1  ORF type:complete len:265 (-),score=94.67 gnl/TRDRNA2_/TRDRNA2_62222_c0_seq1:36-830(-)